jgi:hypothetical protein
MLLCGECYEKGFHLKVYKVPNVQVVEYQCKAVFETLCIVVSLPSVLC